MNADMIKAIGDAVSSVTWPAIVLYLVASQKETIKSILSNLESITLPGGVEAKLRKQIDQQAEAVLKDKRTDLAQVTERQLVAAEYVQRATQNSDMSVIRSQVYELAREYERVRASMTPGDDRTRRMEVVTTKMRTLGLAGLPLLHELAHSDSPGVRLAAIAILQVAPKEEYAEWLTERLNNEQPFVGFHAAVALEAAARVLDKVHNDKLVSLIHRAKSYLGERHQSSDRWQVLDSAEKQLLSQQ